MTVKLNVFLRDKLFWFFDRLSGGGIKNALLELEMVEKWDTASPELFEYRGIVLKRLFEHAVSTTRFYEEQPKGELCLENFPVLDKEQIRARQNDFMSSSYERKELTVMKTSGSTGTPFTSYQDAGKKKRVRAEVIYYCGKAGYFIGKNLLILKASDESSIKDKIQRWLQNITVLNLGPANDQELRVLLDKMARASVQGSILLAYASTYDLLADYFKRNGSDNSCNLEGMISISELLDDHTRARVEEAFNCSCYSRYSNQENGIIGQDQGDNNVFIINEAHYLVEIFQLERDIPAGEGEIGRIVITDFYNYAMPMIRYDTGDIGAFCYLLQNGALKKAICSFSGRKIDLVYDPDGNILSPHQVSVAMRSVNGIRQFQFVQEGNNTYLVRLAVDQGFTGETGLKEKLQSLLGNRAVISFEYAEDIAPAGSGKRNYIINKMSEERA